MDRMREREHALIPVRVALKRRELARYARFVGQEAIEEIVSLADELKGLRVLQLNSTSYGGGVSELLSSLVPLLISAGIDAEWWTLPAHPDFLEVTKRFHNALQGQPYTPSAEDIEKYLDHDRLSAQGIGPGYDIVIVHDPQPAVVRRFAGRLGARWVWRCHIDTSSPDPTVWRILRPYLTDYDAAVFTMRQFIPPGIGIPEDRLFIVPPAIDPLSLKNRELPEGLSEDVLSEFGVDTARPLLTQVSRFDPWKDPLGVIRIYRHLKRSRPELQLAMVGSMAKDDPEAWDIYAAVGRELEGDRDAYLLTNLNGVGALEVNAFQRLSEVVIQKSTREGFGLVVSEALWKRTPVVAGRAGGIPLQMSNGLSRFLVTDEESYAERIGWLLDHRDDARAIGEAGHESVRERFLVTRLLRDELRLFRELLGAAKGTSMRGAGTGAPRRDREEERRL